MKLASIALVSILFLALALSGCGEKKENPVPPANDAANVSGGRTNNSQPATAPAGGSEIPQPPSLPE